MKNTEQNVEILGNVFDNIFELDFEKLTLRNIKSTENIWGLSSHSVRMFLNDALGDWLEKFVFPDDRKALETFFKAAYSDKLNSDKMSIMFRLLYGEEETVWYSGKLVKAEGKIYWFGFNKTSDQKEVSDIRSGRQLKKAENKNKKENVPGVNQANAILKKIIDNGNHAVFVFNIVNRKRNILYISENCCEYFGISKADLKNAEDNNLNDIIAFEPFTSGQYKSLMEKGSGNFEIKLPGEGKIKRNCICFSTGKDYAIGIYKEHTDGDHSTAENMKRNVKITVFGYFDIFVDNVPVFFKNDKSKELLAILVDRKGGYVSASEAISCLWEDEPVNEKTLARYRKTAFNLRTTLEEYDIEYIIESTSGKRRIVPENINCDFYNYLSGKPEYSGLFKGIYMYNYSWGEITLSTLCSEN